MKKKTLQNISFIVIFLAGLSLLLYPLVSDKWNTYRQSKLMASYEQALEEKKEEVDYTAEWQRAIAYNESLYPMILPDSFAVAEAQEEPDAMYMNALNLLGDGMMGIVEIPKIDIKLPIFHTTEEKVLQTAAGHLEGSNLPTGGEGYHAVISAHRGLPSAALFTDLDRMQEGDHFLIHVLDETLCYQVDQIRVVEPFQTEALAVEEGKDLMTLMTCTPYGVNSHRLLVRGHRVAYEPEVEEVLVEEAKAAKQISVHTDYLLWVVVGMAVTAAFIFGFILLEKKVLQKKKVEENAFRKQDVEG